MEEYKRREIHMRAGKMLAERMKMEWEYERMRKRSDAIWVMGVMAPVVVLALVLFLLR